MEFFSQAAESAARLHLLVVDVDPAIRSACAEIAGGLGYAVEQANDFQQARSLLRGRRGGHPAGKPAAGRLASGP